MIPQCQPNQTMARLVSDLPDRFRGPTKMILLPMLLPILLASCTQQNTEQPAPLHFVVQPTSAVVYEGEGCTFQVAVSDRSAAIQWYKDGRLIPGATGPAYTLTQVLEGDEGAYTAVARLPASQASVPSTPATLQYVRLVRILVNGQEASTAVGLTQPVAVTIQPNVRGSRMILYTLDGSEPTPNSTPYLGPFQVAQPCWLRVLVDNRETEAVRFYQASP